MAANAFLYFAYGSNLLRERIVFGNPSAVFQTVARLANYRLVFLGDSVFWRGAPASIEQQDGAEVWGVVWKLDSKDRESLDRQERGYASMEVNVADPHGTVMQCLTYQIRTEGLNPSFPSPQYKDVIVKGARQNKLPPHYLQALESKADNGYKGDIPFYNELMKQVSSNLSSL